MACCLGDRAAQCKSDGCRKLWSRKGALIFKLEKQRPREVKGPDKGHTTNQKQKAEAPLQGSFKAETGLSLTLTAADRAKQSLTPGK